ncbi:hypothetical protein V6N11_047574 [Hibiscus sabdariffa]|uniref:Bet v I/Major latex protein domain-containing protein n=1 Tax=Hibiscus sabdariffa TaxID=183260 RepID=A0ABR2NKW9_9ROSI
MASTAAPTGRLEAYVETDASPEQIHHLLSCMPDHVHDDSPEKILGCDLVRGDFGTPGCVVTWRYMLDGKAEKTKAAYETIDYESKSVTFKVLEGDMKEEFKSFVKTMQASAKNDGSKGSIVHWTVEYEKRHDGVGEPYSLLQLFVEVARDMGAYLKEK